MNIDCFSQDVDENQQTEKIESISVCRLICEDLIVECEVCGKQFNKRSHLYRHQRQKHEDNRAYICEVEQCGKKFKRGSHLKRHMISHSHEKNYKCLKCVMQFGYKHHLDRHIKLVHFREFFKCQECDEQFMKKKSLAKHTKAHSKQRENEEKKKTKKIRKHEKTIKKVDCSEKMNKLMKVKSEQACVENNNKIMEDIYDSENEHADFKQKQINCENSQPAMEEIVYRCVETNCYSAFLNQYSLKKHYRFVHGYV